MMHSWLDSQRVFPAIEQAEQAYKHISQFSIRNTTSWKGQNSQYMSLNGGNLQVLTAIGPSILNRGTLGKTTVPSGIAYTSTSEQSIPLR